MDLWTFEYDRSFILEALRRGEIDYLEHVGEALEGDFFRQLIGRQTLNRLANSYPTPREKEEVPVWLYLASEISLKLHGSLSHHAFPRVLRSGGLIEALGPELGGKKTTHPATGDVTLSCPGFNDKNDYDRQTLCDQDFLRKFARDTREERLHVLVQSRASPVLALAEVARSGRTSGGRCILPVRAGQPTVPGIAAAVV
jgi:hypothetical protein